MYLSDLIDEVVEIIQDPKLGEPQIKNLLNEAYEHILYGTPDPLPALETQGTVQTVLNQAYTALPDDYLRDLSDCYVVDQNQRVRILGSLELLRKKFPGLVKTGNIENVTVVSNMLFYQGIPSTRYTLSLSYFRKPTALAKDRDEPSVIPSYLHRRLLVNYACKELFARIEDGTDGKKVNTNYHTEEYNRAFQELVLWIIPRATEPIETNDTVTDYLE